MKTETIVNAFTTYLKELYRQNGLRSTGSVGKSADGIIRNFVLKNGISKVTQIICRMRDKTDVTRKGVGKFEIKTGCGEIAKGHGLTLDDATPENILSKIDFIAWMPFTLRYKIALNAAMLDAVNDADYETMKNHFFAVTKIASRETYVFTHDEFINCLETIGKNGLRSSVKVAKNGTRLNIQTITPRMEERLFDYIENIPCIADFIPKK